jgi:hypothetical protein
MQFIQTSKESYLLSAVQLLGEAFEEIDIKLEFDFEEFDKLLGESNKDALGMFMLLASVENIHKLDKECKCLNNLVI